MNEITKEFKVFVDIVKNLKSDYIYILNDRVYSIIQGSVIKSSSNNLFQYLNGSLGIPTSELLRIFDYNKESSSPIYICNNCIYCGDISTCFSMMNNYDLHYRLTSIMSVPPIYSNSELRNDDYFNTILSNKTVDGASLYIINNRFPMTIYSALLNVNKSDTVELNIYDIDNISFLSVFRVNKKKFSIDTYVRFLYL